MATYPFRFGRCVNPTFGAVTLDMLDLPHVQASIAVSDSLIGGSTRSLDGTKRQDRFALKREWPAIVLGPWQAMSAWWPVKRLFLAGGPWLFFDHTLPNSLVGDARLMQNGTWTTAAGAGVSTRGDGAVSLAAGGVVQQGASASPSRALLTPVVAGGQFFAGCTVRGPGAWTVTVTIAWWDAAGAAALSTTVGTFTASTALSSCLILDGSDVGYRVGIAGTAPAGTLYAQIRLAITGAAGDVSDPVLIDGPTDPGNAMTVVLVNDMSETHTIVTKASMSLNLSEV